MSLHSKKWRLSEVASMFTEKIENINLYDYYENFVYPVKSMDKIMEFPERKYILFNAAQHFWISMDQIGKEIYQLIHKLHNLKQVKDALKEKYHITDQEFENDALPFIKQLHENQFLSTELVTSQEATWMNVEIPWDNVKSYPFSEMFISLSDSCNLNCLYCFNKENRKHRKEKKNILSTEKIIEVLTEFKELGGQKIIFTGGEPTLNQDLICLCKKAKELALETMMITNGTLLSHIDLKELSNYMDTIGISIDSVKVEELEILWGKNELSLENDIINGLYQLNQLSKEYAKIKVVIMPVITRINLNSIGELVCFMEKQLEACELTWSFTKYACIGREEADTLLQLTIEEYALALLKQLEVSQGMDKKRILEYALGNSGKEMPQSAPHVVTCSPSFFLANNGDIYPCQGTEKDKYYLGNVFEKTLKVLFESNVFLEVRRSLHVNTIEKCKACELRYTCTYVSRPCNSGKDEVDCKEKFIQKLYLKTMLGAEHKG